MSYDGRLKFDTRIDESGFNEGIKKLGTVAKAGLAVLGSAVAGFSVITKNAFDEVARLEQNVGGIETLFGAGSKSLEEYATSIGKTTDEAKQDYEKLMEAQNLALDNANKAYKTAGLSANDYMSTVTSFAAALKQSVADEVEAAKAADQAIIDMSDNANKMGTSMESIQNAYQGFAKQNYTMLDNLKLGYGGTKEEMKRLLEDAEKLSGIEYDISNLADVYSAIHVIQTELGISGISAEEAAKAVASGAMTEEEAFNAMGTTAKEAATTIEGSMSSAKAAWSNFMAGTGTVDELAAAFETAGTVASDRLMEIVPRLIETLPEAGKALVPAVLKIGPSLAEAGLSIMEDLVSGVMEAAPQLPAKAGEIISKLIDGIQDNAPAMLDTAADVLAEFVEGIAQQLPILIPQAFAMVTTLANGIIDKVPTMLNSGISLLQGLVDGIVQQLPALVPQALSMVVTLADNVIANMPTIIKAGISLLKGLIQGIIDSLPILIENGPRIINDFADAIYSGLWELIKAGGEMLLSLLKGIWENVPLLLANAGEILLAFINIFSLSQLFSLGKGLIQKLLEGVKKLGPETIKAGGNILESLLTGIKNMATHPVQTIKGIFQKAMNSIKNLDWLSIGEDIISGITSGLSKSASEIVKAAKSAAASALTAAKNALGIKSPSRRFRDEVGKNMALGMGVGFEDNVPVEDMEASIDNSIQRMKNRVVKITTTSDSAGQTVGGLKGNPELNPEQGGFDFDEYERRQRKLNKERDSRPIFLGTDRIDRPLPKGAVPVW